MKSQTLLIPFMAAIFVVSLIHNASGQQTNTGDWYFSGFGGWVGPTDNILQLEGSTGDPDDFGLEPFDENGDFDIDGSFLTDSGFGIGAALGRRFSNGFRLEGDFVFRNQNFGDLTDIEDDFPGIVIDEDDFDQVAAVSSELSTFTLNMNVAYDFRRGGNFNPYVGVGTGLHLIDISANNIIDDNGFIGDFDLAYPWANVQFFAGVSKPINQRTELFVEYRGLSTIGVDFSTNVGDGGVLGGFDSASLRSSAYHSSVFFGFRTNIR